MQTQRPSHRGTLNQKLTYLISIKVSEEMVYLTHLTCYVTHILFVNKFGWQGSDFDLTYELFLGISLHYHTFKKKLHAAPDFVI